MCVPGVSENKAIAVAKAFPTYSSLMTIFEDSNLAEKDIYTQEQQRTEGENFLSKSNNKFYFRLLQIFGFRDDPPMSFINKDLMKFEYF